MVELSAADSIWEDLQEQIGEDLRVVTCYDSQDYETVKRDDVMAQYTIDEDRDIVTDTLVKQLVLSESESEYKTGNLQGFVRIFDEAWVLTWSDTVVQKSGILISIDRGEECSMEGVTYCIDYLEEHFG